MKNVDGKNKGKRKCIPDATTVSLLAFKHSNAVAVYCRCGSSQLEDHKYCGRMGREIIMVDVNENSTNFIGKSFL